MAQLKQGAPGVRIKLRDVSEVTLVTSPNIVGGVVGFSAKGEFNKIMKLNSTSDVDVNLGGGYNNPRYNQGLYAARSVLTAGGFVEYVRPYGEAVINDSASPLYAYNQNLKSDTYFVTYDFSEDVNADAVRPDSFDINYWASTRYVNDAYGSFGTRQINTIAETIVNNSNIDFSLNVDNMADGEGGFDKVGLFSIMNTDPTSANRAGDKYDVSNINSSSATVSFTIATIQGQSATTPYIIKVVTLLPHMLNEGDSVIISGTTTGIYDTTSTGAITLLDETSFTFKSDLINSQVLDSVGSVSYNELTISVTTRNANLVTNGSAVSIGGTVNYNNPNAIATRKTQKTFEYYIHTLGVTGFPAESTGAVFLNLDTVVSGVDYLQLKTAARGGSSKYFDVLSLNAMPVSGDNFGFIKPTGEKVVFEFQTTGVDNGAGTVRVPVITTGVTGFADGSDKLILVDSTANLSVNDLVSFTFTGSANGGITSGNQYVISNITGNYIQVNNTTLFAPAVLANATFSAVLNNLTATLRSVQNAVKNEGYIGNSTRASFEVKTGIQAPSTIKLSTVNKFGIGDILTVYNHFDATGLYPVSGNGLVDGGYYVIAAVNISESTITIKSIDLDTGITSDVTLNNAVAGSTATFINLTQTNAGVSWLSDSVVGSSGSYKPQLLSSTWLGLKVPVVNQESNDSVFVVGTSPIDNDLTIRLASTDDGILIDNSVGADFLSLGIAVDAYIDTNFDGIAEKVYLLTDIGRQVARIYLYVNYFFAGNSFVFSGTVIPFAVNDTNLSIVETANSIAVGWKYIPNDSASVQNSVQSPAFDLAQSQSGNIIKANWSQIAFNPMDPAVLNNAIWAYDPNKNNNTLTFSSAWQLFLDKDIANSDMLISAGTAIINLFIKGREELNYDVMNVMLDVCEKRKDLFAIFDGVNESNINKALEKMVGIGGNGDLARWGGIYDGRSLFFDSAYTKLIVEGVQTISIASIITANRSGNAWWLPPAGYDTGRMPAQWSRSQLYTRTYKYADDANSDIARLYDSNINPVRVNDQGQFVYGQKTMLKRTSALNRMNVIMLIAGIHKRFSNYLDSKVFQLNTSTLRANIQADLQASLNGIQSANPAGITAGLVICDGSNNTPIIIDTNQLIVDVSIQPTRSIEFITLRTTVQRTGADLNVSTSTIIGG